MLFSMSLASVPPPLLPPVLYEDADLLIVNKPAGLVVHVCEYVAYTNVPLGQLAGKAATGGSVVEPAQVTLM